MPQSCDPDENKFPSLHTCEHRNDWHCFSPVAKPHIHPVHEIKAVCPLIDSIQWCKAALKIKSWNKKSIVIQRCHAVP